MVKDFVCVCKISCGVLDMLGTPFSEQLFLNSYTVSCNLMRERKSKNGPDFMKAKQDLNRWIEFTLAIIQMSCLHSLLGGFIMLWYFKTILNTCFYRGLTLSLQTCL